MEEGRDGSGVATEPRSFGVKEFHHRGPDLNKKDAFQLNWISFFCVYSVEKGVTSSYQLNSVMPSMGVFFGGAEHFLANLLYTLPSQ